VRVEAERPSIPNLFRELSGDVGQLVRQEIELAKTELTEKAGRLAKDAAAVAVAGGILFAAGLALLAAFIYGATALLDQFLPLGVAVWLGPLLVAAVLGAWGYAQLKTALAALAQERQARTLTAESLQENKQWLKRKM